MRIWSKKILSGGGVLVIVSMVVNLMNFGFNAVLGRILTYADFGVINLFSTFSYVIGVAMGAFGMTVNQRSAFLKAKFNEYAGVVFMKRARKWAFLVTIILAFIWLAFAPLFMRYFQVANIWLALGFAPVIVFSAVTLANIGFLHGNFLFVSVSVVILMEVVFKAASAFILAAFGLHSFVAFSLPISAAAACIFALWLTHRAIITMQASNAHADTADLVSRKEIYTFPKRFFLASMLTVISAATFLSLDVALAKHYLSADLAGHYALLSLVGKIIFFVGTLASNFILTFVSHEQGKDRNPNRTFHALFATTALLSITAGILLGPFGSFFVPLLLGPKAIVLAPYLTPYALAITLFSLTNAFIFYHLAKKDYAFSIASIAVSILMAVGIALNHSDISQIVGIILYSSAAGFIIILSMHYWKKNGVFVLRNLVDLVDVFYPVSADSGGKRADSSVHAEVAATSATRAQMDKTQLTAATGKRILIFNWRDTGHVFAGGAEVYVHELAKRWVKTGNKVTLFCGNDGLCPRNETIDGIEIVRRGGFYFVYLWAFLYYLIQFRGRYDFIIDCQNGIPFFAPMYAKEPVYCVVHHIHQEIFRKYLPEPLAIFAKLLEKKLMPFVYKNTRLVTVSESTKNEMLGIGMGACGIEIIYNGIDLQALKPDKKDAHALVLYLGRLKAYKSVGVLIKAFKDVYNRLPNVRLIIAGSGEEQYALQNLVAELGLENCIAFEGRVSNARKIELLQKAWVLVNPSWMEGWGITTIEANACGTPVIASDVPGLRDSVKHGHTGLLVEHGNVQIMSEQILTLLSDSSLRHKLALNGIEWAKNFDWVKSGDDFLALMSNQQEQASDRIRVKEVKIVATDV